VVDFKATEAHANPMGTAAGGVLLRTSRDIRDGSRLLVPNLDEGVSSTTLELKINFMKASWRARLKAGGEWFTPRGARFGMGRVRITRPRKGSLGGPTCDRSNGHDYSEGNKAQG